MTTLLAPSIAPPIPRRTRKAISAAEVRRERAERRGEAEQREAGEIERLAPGDLGEAREGRQDAGEGEHIADRDPAHRVERRVEGVLEGRHGELDDAGVHLAHEGADADRADDEPRIGRPALEERRRRGFGQFKAPVQSESRSEVGRGLRQPIHAGGGRQRVCGRRRNWAALHSPLRARICFQTLVIGAAQGIAHLAADVRNPPRRR